MQLINENSSILDLDYEVETSFPEETPVSIELIEQPVPEDEDTSFFRSFASTNKITHQALLQSGTSRF